MISSQQVHLGVQVYPPQTPINAELYGFIGEGLVFEVVEGGWVGQVTCFKA
jgi:hypothetical protein